MWCSEADVKKQLFFLSCCTGIGASPPWKKKRKMYGYVSEVDE